MYFDLTDEQKAIQESLRSMLRGKFDARETVRRFDMAALDRELWRELMGLGLGSMLVPESQGGLGLDLLTLSVVAETLGYFGVPAPVVDNALAAWIIAGGDDAALNARWVARLAEGDALAAFALSENGRWLPQDWTVTGSRLTGRKDYVEWGASADLFIVGLAGGGLGLVEAESGGVSVVPVDTLDQTRPMASLLLKNAPVAVLGGLDAANRLVDALLVLLAADACGAGSRAYEMAVEYAQSRTQFGRTIGSFQALKHQLANMAVDIEPCRSLYWYAAHAWDSLPDKQERAAATAKAHIGDVAVKTARAAVEAHGGIGYTWEYPLHIFLKRAMHSRIAMGLPSVHRERVGELAGW